MEGTIAKRQVPDIRKQSRSSDLKTIYGDRSRDSLGISRDNDRGSGASQESKVLMRKHGSSLERGGYGFMGSTKKRSRREVSLSSFDPAGKRSRNGMSRLKPNGFVSGIRKQKNSSRSFGASHNLSNLSDNSHNTNSALAAPPAKDESNQALTVGNWESLNCLDGSVIIPKRPRGVSRRKRSETAISVKRASGTSTCSGKSHADVETSTLPVNLVAPSRESIDQQNEDFDELKEIGSGRYTSDYSIKGANDTSVKTSRRKLRSRKLQVSTMETQTHRENEACLADDDQKSFEHFLDDDEENLEQNAARMLSSRFDPRCTVFSGNMKTSSEPANESSLQLFRRSFKGSGSEAEGRSLRPRKHNGKGFVRKRRHFYEVRYSDMDPYWVIKQRIRVFWPLDQSWYFGLVKNYDPVTKLHHVKYDDRDEEWINLQKERFKLLLFPSEIKFCYEKSESKVKKKHEEGDENTMGDNSIGSIMESETIISWLARSNSPVTQKQKRNHLLKDFAPSILSASNGHMSVSPSNTTSNKLSSSCIVLERLIEREITRMPMMKSRTDSDNRKLSFVYFRKRFRRREGLGEKRGGNSVCVRSTGPISLIASVSDRESALEELFVSITPRELKQITLKLSLPLRCIQHHAFGAELFLLFSTLLLHHGKLIPLWPRVHMEIVFVHNALGLRFLSFEGCLRWAVTLVCSIMATFCQNEKCNKLSEMQVPSTSMGFKLSGVHDQGRQFLFAMYSFMELEGTKWRFLENKLKQHCMTTRVLPIEDCTYVNIKTLSGTRNGQIFHASIFEDPFSFKGYPEESCSDILRRLIINKSACLHMDPAPYFTDENSVMLPSCTLSFAAAPSFFLSMHLKLLMENNATAVSFQNLNSTSSLDCPENYEKLTGEGCSPVEGSPDQVSEITNENFGPSFSQAAANSGWVSSGHLKVETDGLSMSSEGDWVRSCHKSNSEVTMTVNPVGQGDVGKNASDETFVRFQQFTCHTKSNPGPVKSCSPFHEDSSYPDGFEAGYSSFLNTTDVQPQLFTQFEERLSDREKQAAHSASDSVWGMYQHTVRSPKTTAPRSISHGNRHSSVSPTFGQCSNLGQEDFIQIGFVNASRKPRTQVSYSLPTGDYELGSEHRSHHKKGRIYKKIKTYNSKNISGGPESPQSYLGSLTCYANVLVTVADRGWRECGAQLVLDSDDQKDWRMSVKFSGTTKYVYKAHQLLQPGITNRYNHAMMWKGGKDWTLEFTDRIQWSVFKVMHEECLNRNTRAASVKNIPIPGVCLIDDGAESIVEVPFIRSSSKYDRQVGTEVDMALDPSHVLYDMGSDDDEWISNLKNTMVDKGCEMAEVTDEMFERVMDMFEKIAYAKQCDRLSSDEIEELMADFGPMDIIKAIHEHWWQKRQKKGLPLIRQFQPALWEHYQRQLKEWDLAMSKMHNSSNLCQERACMFEKPPMFAFCLRPRGLEVPNECSKQKCHRKLMFTGHHDSLTREQDGLHAYGRKLNRLPVEAEKALFTVPNHEYFSHLLQSPSSILPKDAARKGALTMTSDGFDRSRYPKLYRNNSKKNKIILSPKDSRLLPFSYNERSKRHGDRSWGTDMCEWPSRTKQSQPDGFQRHRADIDEFKLRDASSAAQHASNMAKLKQEKAQWLLHKADLALHKATVALMTAEAIKASQDLIGDG